MKQKKDQEMISSPFLNFFFFFRFRQGVPGKSFSSVEVRSPSVRSMPRPSDDDRSLSYRNGATALFVLTFPFLLPLSCCCCMYPPPPTPTPHPFARVEKLTMRSALPRGTTTYMVVVVMVVVVVVVVPLIVKGGKQHSVLTAAETNSSTARYPSKNLPPPAPQAPPPLPPISPDGGTTNHRRRTGTMTRGDKARGVAGR